MCVRMDFEGIRLRMEEPNFISGWTYCYWSIFWLFWAQLEVVLIVHMVDWSLDLHEKDAYFIVEMESKEF